MSRTKPRAHLASAATLAVCSVVFVGCTGSIDGSMSSSGGPPLAAGGSSPGPAPAAGIDPGRVAIHRLNNTEYDNTVRDLLGTAKQPTAMFLAEEGLNFDNTATALGMTSSQYEGYLEAASDLIDESLTTDAERARFMTCTPTVSADPCARTIIQTFGMQIYRRPLESAEVDRAMKVYDADIARMKPGTEAVGQALRAMLSAANFLYRIEYDSTPSSTAPHALSGYELASRLSYLNWSSMPDAALFDAAKSGKLLEPTTLEASVDRLLTDPKANAFVESFAGQWLGIRKLLTHSVTAQIFPTYTAALSDAMIAEGNLWFQEFLNKDRPISDWFTADFNYVNDTLAAHYGFAAPGSAQLVRVEVTTDQRKGFLGLASFLTQTSFPSRTSPTLRGAWLLGNLLCDAPPPPPPDVPKLDETPDPMDMNNPSGAVNVRVRLEKHRQDPTCNACHKLMDPLGLGLERYDGIGAYRETYPNGDVIDPQGVLPDGTAFAGPEQLGATLGKDPRFSACVETKLFTYALGREVEDLDAATLQSVQTKWAARGLTFKNLIKEVVLTDAFRFRRGEAP